MKRKDVSLIVLLLALSKSSVASECIPGLSVYNGTNDLILPWNGCNEVIPIKALEKTPTVVYDKANNSDSYLIMLLESIPGRPGGLISEMYYLHWIVTGVKAQTGFLQTRPGLAHDLASGYIAPRNQTQYEFRLYNLTGKSIWDTVAAPDRYTFAPSKWLAKNSIYDNPIAKRLFYVQDYVPKPPGWVVPPYPVEQQTYQPLPQQPQQPTQQLPHHFPPPPQQLPHQPPQQQVHLPQYPSQNPPAPYPPQAPVSQPNQPPPLSPQQPSSYQPSAPIAPQSPPHLAQQPPFQPSQIYPQPHPVQPVNIYPAHPQQEVTALHVQKQYNINGTMFRVFAHDKMANNILNINSTMYTSDNYNKRFKLSRYLIIDNKSYILRNETHNPGKGPSVYINGTHYVPYVPPTTNVHHHYHKGSGSSLNPSVLLFIFLMPFFFISFTS